MGILELWYLKSNILHDISYGPKKKSQTVQTTDKKSFKVTFSSFFLCRLNVMTNLDHFCAKKVFSQIDDSEFAENSTSDDSRKFVWIMFCLEAKNVQIRNDRFLVWWYILYHFSCRKVMQYAWWCIDKFPFSSLFTYTREAFSFHPHTTSPTEWIQQIERKGLNNRIFSSSSPTQELIQKYCWHA